VTDLETTANAPAAPDGRRALLHPLKDAGIGETAGTGAWVRLKAPGELEKVHFPEDNPALGAGISSVPSPWARLELFRDAVRDAPQTSRDVDAHPFSGDAIQDILDALELLVFEGHMDGLVLRRHLLDLDSLAALAVRENEDGIRRFLGAVRDLAPRADGNTRLGRLTIVTDGRGRLLFATSPFTLFFTPEDRTTAVPGYFGARETPRPLDARPPELARFVEHHLLPRLARHGSQHPELQRLVSVLQRQLEEVPHELRGIPLESLDEEGALQPVAGVPVGRVRTLAWSGRNSLVPTREAARRPLVLHDQTLESERTYFPWLAPSMGTRVADAADRRRLPGSAWRHDWVNPERDFLVDNLLILELTELDLTSVLGREIYGDMSSQVNWRRPGQVLLPLSAEYFEYFGPEDAVRHLRMTMDPDGNRVEARLTIPVEGGERTFKKVYTRGENLAAEQFYLSVWPNFVPEPGEFEWSCYSVFHLAIGRGANEFDVRMGLANGEAAASGEYGAAPVRRFPRQGNAAFYGLEEAPRYLRVRLRRHAGSNEFVAEGVVLPKFETVRSPTAAPWTVAVDLGTSNTSVAVRKRPDARAELLNLAGRVSATRLDLMRAPAPPEGSRRSDVSRILDTLYFPDVVPAHPFPTFVVRSTIPQDRDNESLFALPAATANIAFRGDLTSGAHNRLEGDLKWGGGLARIEHNLLTEQFLKQLLVLIYAESVRSGARVDSMALRWSYPSAFTAEESDQLIQRWRNVLRWFRDARLGLSGKGEGQAGAAPEPFQRIIGDADLLPDESTSSLWFFKTQPGFSVHDEALALTVDLGGGTTDIAGYANLHGQFRNSILLGGRDLVGTPPSDEGRRMVNAFYRSVEGWALERMGRDSKQMLTDVTVALHEYPTSHGKFGYLVRHPWFAEHRSELLEEPWFRSAQACIVYLFGAIFFHLGVLVRADRDAGGRYEPPARVIFGGNGAQFLDWLTGFRPFAGSRPGQDFFGPLFRDIFEASLGSDLPSRLDVSVSEAPKQEVALGLLTAEADHVLQPADGQGTGGRTPTDDAPGSIRMHHPVGEVARFPDKPDGVLPGSRVTLSGQSGAMFAFATEFETSMIRRYHDTLLDGLGRADAPHREWPGVRDRITSILRECDRGFYVRTVREELERRLRGNSQLNPSVFSIEVAATLRHLQTGLFPAPQDVGR
jgi:hypothetical protein